MELLTKQVGTGRYAGFKGCHRRFRQPLLPAALCIPAGSRILAGSCLAWLCDACARLGEALSLLGGGKQSPRVGVLSALASLRCALSLRAGAAPTPSSR